MHPKQECHLPLPGYLLPLDCYRYGHWCNWKRSLPEIYSCERKSSLRQIYLGATNTLFGCNKELQMKKKKAYRKPEFRLDALTFLYFVRFFTHYLKLSKIQTNFITNNISWPAAPAQTLSLPRNNSQWNPVHLIFRVICE